MRTLQCRAHGGTFAVVPSRGRPPVNCGGKNELCSRATKLQVAKLATAEGGPIMPAKRAEVITPANNPSLAPALTAKARLEPLGWLCKGKAVGPESVEMMATRDDELIIMRWKNGLVSQQEYILWDEKPSANGKPKGELTFDPDECTDIELVRALAGMKVKWWNVLGQKEETGIISAGKIKVEHAFNGVGDETPGDRIVHFTDHTGTGFRSFRVAALLKVGS